MSDLKRKESELPEPTILEKIKEDSQVNVGDIFMKDNWIIRIQSMKDSHNLSYEYLSNMEPVEWELSQYTMSMYDLKGYYKRVDPSMFTEGHELYLKYTKSEDLSSFNVDESIDNSTAIIAIGSKEYLEQMQNTAILQSKRIQTMRMFVMHEMELAKNKANFLRRQLEDKLVIFKKQIRKIYKVIQTIELYLGISEDLVQIQEGASASPNTPISFRQSILFMDEEVAVWENGGLDYSNIAEFEKWLTTDNNYEKCIPEEKGMVVFKPRRLRKHYSDNRIDNAIQNSYNKTTYFLIRNGENIYRISSENIAISQRLFPRREELKSMLESVEEQEYESRKEEAKEKFEDVFEEYRCMAFLMQGLIDRTEIFTPLPFKINIFNMEEIGDAVQFIYDDEIALPTGRLPFWDWHKSINSQIKAGSRILLTGYYGGTDGRYEPNDRDNRLARSYNKYNTPDMPKLGVYEVFSRLTEVYNKTLPHYEIERLQSLGLVKEVSNELEESLLQGYETFSTNIQPLNGVQVQYFTGRHNNTYIKAYECTYMKEELYIKYNPKDKVTHGWSDFEDRERKNSLSFKIYSNDGFVLNYDHISIEDIDFYLHSRSDRKNYHSLMPLLKTIKAKLLAEMANEQSFIKLMVGRIISANIADVSEEKATDFVEELISWWKFRTLQKRPISKDDTLAMRMIEKRLLAAVNRKKLINKD